MQFFVRQVYVHHAPDGDFIEVFNAAAVVVAHLQIERNHPFLIVQYTYRHSVRSGRQRTRHVSSLDTGAQGIFLSVFCHERFSFRFPIILYRIGVHIRRASHDGFGLCAQLAQHGRVGACELHFDRVRGRSREIVFADADIGIGILLAKLLPYRGDLFQHGIVVLAIDGQFPVAVAARSHRTYQTIEGRGTALTDGDPVDVGILREPVAHLQQPVTHDIGIGSRRKETLDNELFVVEIGKEKIFHLCHSENTESQQAERYDDSCLFVAD